MIPKTEVCPYFGKEEREKWHREKGITDPKSPWGRLVEASESPRLERSEEVIEVKVEPVAEDRRARWRRENKEKLAAKARERRALKNPSGGGQEVGK